MHIIATSAEERSHPSAFCSGIEGFENSGKDASVILQRCIDDAKDGSILKFKAGVVYTLSNAVVIRKPIELTTAGASADSAACDSEGAPPCAQFFRDPLRAENAALKGSEALFEITSPDVSLHHLVLNGIGELSLTKRPSCSNRSLLRIKGSSSTVISKVVFKNNACGDTLDIRASRRITVRGSSFLENGTKSTYSSGITISNSKGVDVIQNYLFNNTKFDINVQSCWGCTIRENVAFHSPSPGITALASFRVASGDVAVADNLSDCGGTGCVADYIIGNVKAATKKTSSDIKLFGNASLNPQTGFVFGRGTVINLVDNFAIGGERICDGTPYFAFTKLPGARVVMNGSRLSARHIKEVEVSLKPLHPDKVSLCMIQATSGQSLPQASPHETSIANTVQNIFRREVNRPAKSTEVRKFGKMIANQQLTLRGLIARVRGLGSLVPSSRIDNSPEILPQRCFPEKRQGHTTEICIEQVGEDGLVDGDIRIPGLFSPTSRDSVQAEGLGLKITSRLWPGGVVPYVINHQVPAAVKSSIMAIINTYNSLSARTRVRFIPRTTQANYIQFTYVRLNSSACADSFVGMIGGAQDVRINSDFRACTLNRSLIHELGHTLGLKHEHQRPDRDQFIKIYVHNSIFSADTTFMRALRLEEGFRPLGPYDTASVMHYSSYESSFNGLPVMVTTNRQLIPINDTLSAGDVASLAQLYAAQTAPPPKPQPTATPKPQPTTTPRPPQTTPPTLAVTVDPTQPIPFTVNYGITQSVQQIDYAVIETTKLLTSAQMSGLQWPNGTIYIGRGSPAFLPRSGSLPLAIPNSARCIAVRARAADWVNPFSQFTYTAACRP